MSFVANQSNCCGRGPAEVLHPREHSNASIWLTANLTVNLMAKDGFKIGPQKASGRKATVSMVTQMTSSVVK
jgi:hypothetical protein